MTYKLLSEGKKILPIYFELEDKNKPKSFTEKQQAENIISMFIEDFPNQISKLIIRLVPFKKSQWDSWSVSVKEFISNNNFISEVAFGWNQSDLRNEKDVNKFRERALEFKRKGKKVKALFPIFNLNKIEMASSLPKKYLHKVFSCEFPLYSKDQNEKWICQSCQKCNACLLQKMLGIYMSIEYELANQPSDELAMYYNNSQRLLVYNDLYVNGECPMHLKENTIHKINR